MHTRFLMDPVKIINGYYKRDSQAYNILIEHGRMVAAKAVDIARKIKWMDPDIQFIEEAAMLHDIGIFLTREPRMGCYGDKEYICHGYLGRELLDKEGFPRHALVCERHIGVGLTVGDIRKQNLDLPLRDMSPVSLEEKIICFADKFFSKRLDTLHTEKSLDEVRKSIEKFGHDKLIKFEEMAALFSS